MAKIFQLELFIKEMEIWKLPNGIESWDDTCVDFTLFDIKNVSIKKDAFDENEKPKNRGQNFLFTLCDIPVDRKNMFFHIYKKPYKKDKKYVGTGHIPIDEIFGDIFLKTFEYADENDAGNDNQPQTDDKDGLNSAGKVDVTATKSSKTDSKVTQKKQQSSGNVTATKSKNDSKSSQKGKQNASSKTSKTDPKDDQKKSDSDAAVAEKLKKKFKISSLCPPLTKLTKDIYPIVGPDSNQWGMVCILMRLTSYGNFSAHSVHVHQNHKEIIIQNSQNTALYKRVSLDDLLNSDLYETSNMPKHFGYISSFPSDCKKDKIIYHRGPKVNDFNFQCNEGDIIREILDAQALTDSQIGTNVTAPKDNKGGKSGKESRKQK